VGLPLFSAHGDPGPSFWHFAQMSGLDPEPRQFDHETPHATTVVALRYVGGVVMVGDRQATGNYIASRDVRKSKQIASPPSLSRGAPRAASSYSSLPNSLSSTTRR
jgi:hypothetical protein